MSNKAMKPKKRFPEFRDSPAWIGKPMGEVYSFKGNNSLSRDQLNYEHGSVKNIHYGDIHTKFSTLFDITKETVPYINPSESLDGFNPDNDCVEGDMIFADASEDLADIGKSIEVIRLNDERVISGQHTILARPNDDSLVVGFGAYLFKSAPVRTQIQKESQGSKVLGISAKRLTKIELPIPSTKSEQQKIAECLTSLDEVMAAHGQKLDALKTHKQGLMQQLFPRAGETVPRLRFPGFQAAPEWEEMRLGDVCEKIMDGTHFSPKTKTGPRLYLTSKNIQDGKIDLSKISYISEEDHRDIYNRCPVKIHDVLLTKDGANTGNCALNDLDIEFSLLSSVAVLRGKPSVLGQRFLYQSILSERNQELIAESMSGQAITRITLEKIGNFIISVANIEEQERIADCLSSLDEMIFAQTQKLDALKTHKKGLMQQLFPSTETES